MSRSRKRDEQFQFLVLQGLWAIVLFLVKKDLAASRAANRYREGALRFGDEFGLPGEDAQKVRRETTYEEI